MKDYIVMSYCVARDRHVLPSNKLPAIYGMSETDEGNVMFPLAYIKKPKNLSQESFESVLDSINLSLPAGFVAAWESTQ